MTSPAGRDRRAVPSAAVYLARLVWVCVVPLTLLASWFAIDQVLTIQANRTAEGFALARNVAEAVERRLAVVAAGLRTLAASPLIDQGDLAAFQRQASGTAEVLGGGIALADRTRTLIVSTRRPFGSPLPPLSPDNTAVIPAFEAGQAGVSDVIADPVTNTLVTALVVPVRRGDAIPYVLVATMDLGVIQRDVERVLLPADRFVRVFDGNGTVTARTPLIENRLGRSVSEALQTFPADDMRAPLRNRTADGTATREFLARVPETSWTVALAMPEAAWWGPFIKTGLVLAALVLGVAVAAAAAGRLATRRLARAIAALAAGGDGASSGVREVDSIRDVLREREAQWRHFVELTPQVPWIATADGRLLDIGPRWMRMTGRQREDTLAHGWDDLAHPDDRHRLTDAWRRSLTGGEPLDQDVRLRTADGTHRWMRFRAFPRRGDDGAVTRWYGLTEDIDDRRAAERQALESGARLAAIVAQAAAGIAQTDPDGRFVLVNDRFCDIVGRPRDDLLSQTIESVTHPDDWRANDAYLRRLSSHGEAFTIDKRYRRGDGTTVWVTSRVSAMHDDAGRLSGILAVVFDLTERRAMEQALADSRDQLRRAVENAPFPIMVHAEDGEVIHLSRAWLDATGYRAEEIATVQAWTARAYGERTETARTDIERLYALDRPIDEGEYTVRTAEGRLRTWAFRSSPIGRDGQGRRLVVSMAADLTERKEAEARLRLLMSEVDHRAKNALSVVQSIVLLSRAEDPGDFAEAVQGRVAAMARAHTLLSTARWSGADLEAMVREELAAYATTQRVAAGGVPIAIKAESAQAVSMALHELATNAAKYGALSAPGGHVDVTWRREAATGRLLLEWTESGGPPIGRPTHHGFGSELLRRTVEGQLRGTVSKEWAPTGLRCQITLPHDCYLTSGVCNPAPLTPHTPANDHPDADGARVLVVEDEALTALALAQVLRDAGFQVIGPVGRVQDAIDLARARPPEVAVLDVNLFGQPSFPVAEALDAMGVPFVFCTGYGSLDTPDERMHRAPVLTKPVSPERLAGTLNALLAAGQRPATGITPSC